MTWICFFTNNIIFYISVSISRHKILYSYSLINNTEDVVKDTTREEVPLQSISLEHNIVYDETKPSNEQQQ